MIQHTYQLLEDSILSRVGTSLQKLNLRRLIYENSIFKAKAKTKSKPKSKRNSFTMPRSTKNMMKAMARKQVAEEKAIVAAATKIVIEKQAAEEKVIADARQAEADAKKAVADKEAEERHAKIMAARKNLEQLVQDDKAEEFQAALEAAPELTWMVTDEYLAKRFPRTKGIKAMLISRNLRDRYECYQEGLVRLAALFDSAECYKVMDEKGFKGIGPQLGRHSIEKVIEDYAEEGIPCPRTYPIFKCPKIDQVNAMIAGRNMLITAIESKLWS